MEEIYSEARCAILLLRSARLQLEPLLGLRDRIRCPFCGSPRFRDIAYMVAHECLFGQSCASLPAVLPGDLETGPPGASRAQPVDVAAARVDPAGDSSESELRPLVGRLGKRHFPRRRGRSCRPSVSSPPQGGLAGRVCLLMLEALVHPAELRGIQRQRALQCQRAAAGLGPCRHRAGKQVLRPMRDPPTPSREARPRPPRRRGTGRRRESPRPRR